MVNFKLGLDFASKAIAKEAMCNYRLCQAKSICIDKDDKKMLVVRCGVGYPFHLRITLNTQRQVWQVR